MGPACTLHPPSTHLSTYFYLYLPLAPCYCLCFFFNRMYPHSWAFPSNNKATQASLIKLYYQTLPKNSCVQLLTSYCIHSIATFIGTPVSLLIHAIIHSANQESSAQCINSSKYRSRASHRRSHQTSE